MLHTETILNTFLSNYMHMQVTQIQLGSTETWRGLATHPAMLKTVWTQLGGSFLPFPFGGVD